MINRSFLLYFTKFILTFCVLYYGTIAMIGITSPGGFYSSFAHHYLDYVSVLRWLLLHCSSLLLLVTGFPVFLKDIFTIKLVNGLGIHVGYDCIGYGVMSFWVAFIFANNTGRKKSIKWMIGGLLLIFVINVLRVAIMLVAINQHWVSPFGFDNHTWFNIVAYIAIFTMIYFFDRSEKKRITGIA